jgi:AcrR family transcriptional regulator
MPRTVKSADARQEEILEAARRLFFADGYEQVSVQSIIDAIGLSKGAFYHHFASKEALLETLIEHLARTRAATMRAALTGDGPPIDKVARYFEMALPRVRRELVAALSLMRTLYRPENLRLRIGLENAGITHGAPVLAEVLEEGNATGACDCPQPWWTAELVLQLGATLNDRIAAELFGDRRTVRVRRQYLLSRAEHHGDAIARLIGAPEGRIRLLTAADLDRVLAAARALHREDRR